MKNLHLFSPGVKHTESYFAWVPVPITELAWRTHTNTHTSTSTHSPHTQTHKGLKRSYGITKGDLCFGERVTYDISAGEFEGAPRLTC